MPAGESPGDHQVLLESKVPTDLAQQPQISTLELLSSKEDTRQLVSEIKEVLDNPDYDQAIQEAIAKAGVAERLKVQQSSTLAGSQRADEGWKLSSPRSTITFTNPETGPPADKGAASTAGNSAAKSSGTSAEGGHELKQQVENLLQRTDSMLSRSSGRSSLHRTVSNTPLHSLNATANPSPHAPTPLHHVGGFDFDAALPALATPTMKSNTGSGLRESAGAASGGYSLTGTRRRTTANYFTTGRSAGGQNEISNANGQFNVGMTSPESDTPPIGGGAGALDGVSPSSGDGVGGISHARRLSQQTLSEIGDRFDGHGKPRGFESGSSADRTTVVLGKSASWKIRAAREAAGPYTNFAPLEQLVDAVTESVAAGVQGGFAAAAAGAAATAAGISAAVVGTTTAGSDSAAPRVTGGSVVAAPPKQHVPHKVALANMLLPEYVESVALARLKAELASLSESGGKSKGGGKGEFEKILQALTSRIAQWAQLEKASEEMFHKMLNTILDKVFSGLIPGRTGLQQLADTAGMIGDDEADDSNVTSTDGAIHGQAGGMQAGSFLSLGSGAPAGAAVATASSKGAVAGRPRSGGARASKTADSSSQRASQDATRQAALGADGNAAADSAVVEMKPSDSMLKAAFAKLALGQAMLRGGMPMKANTAAQAAAPASAAAAAAACVARTVSAPTAQSAAAAGDDADTIAGTPDVGLSPAVSRTSSAATDSSTLPPAPQAAATRAAAAAAAGQQHLVQQPRVQWAPAVATVPAVPPSRSKTALDRLNAAAAASPGPLPAMEPSFGMSPGAPRVLQVQQQQQRASPVQRHAQNVVQQVQPPPVPVPAAAAARSPEASNRRSVSPGTFVTWLGTTAAADSAAPAAAGFDMQHQNDYSDALQQQAQQQAGAGVQSAWLAGLNASWQQQQQQRYDMLDLQHQQQQPAPWQPRHQQQIYANTGFANSMSYSPSPQSALRPAAVAAIPWQHQQGYAASATQQHHQQFEAMQTQQHQYNTPQPPSPQPPLQQQMGCSPAGDRALQPPTATFSPTLARLRNHQQQQLMMGFQPQHPWPQQQAASDQTQWPQQQQQHQQATVQQSDTCTLSTATPYGVMQASTGAPQQQLQWQQQHVPAQRAWGSPGVSHQQYQSRTPAYSDASSVGGLDGPANLNFHTSPGHSSSWARSSGTWIPAGCTPLSRPLQQQHAQSPVQQQLQRPGSPPQRLVSPSPLQPQQQQQPVLQHTRRTWVLPVHTSDSSQGNNSHASTPPQQQLQQQQVTAGPQPGRSPAATANSKSPAASMSKTLASMQQRCDQEQRAKMSLFQQQPQQQPEAQSWLAPDGSLTSDASPGRRYQSSSTSPGGCSGNGVYYTQDQSPYALLQGQQLQQGSPLFSGSTAVRVKSPGAPGSPLKHCVPMAGGCINVYSDGVEVQSSAPLEITVTPGPPVPATGVAVANIGGVWR